jgi:hypothetical protein
VFRSSARALPAWLRPRAGGGEDRGSIAMAVLVGIVGSGLVAVLMPMVLVQIHSSTFDESRAHELNAAQAGTSVGLAMVRAAADPSDPQHPDAVHMSELPCEPLTGTLGSPRSAIHYTMRVGYFTRSPIGRLSDQDWLSGQAMTCTPGVGPQNRPSYAVITSTGSDGRGSRTLRSIYQMQPAGSKIVYLFSPVGATTYCMDAPAMEPGDKQVVLVLQQCEQPVPEQQSWVYRSDLSIQLVASVTSEPPNGLCIESINENPHANGTDNGKQHSGNLLALEPCQPLGDAPFNQQWHADDQGHLQGSDKNTGKPDGLCIQAGSTGVPASGTSLQLTACSQAWKLQEPGLTDLTEVKSSPAD